MSPDILFMIALAFGGAAIVTIWAVVAARSGASDQKPAE